MSTSHSYLNTYVGYDEIYETIKQPLCNTMGYALTKMKVFYGDKEITDHLTTYNIYNNSTLNIEIDYEIDLYNMSY